MGHFFVSRAGTRVMFAIMTVMLLCGAVVVADAGSSRATAAEVAPVDVGVAAASVDSAANASVGAGVVKTADLSQFQPGNIVSDAVFFDSSTMSAGQIQDFLNGKVPSCQSGYTCLKDFRQTTSSRSASAYCNGYSGASDESAATIIYKVAVSCGINPQALLVILQKEQGLVTHTWPSDWRYTIAMGQGCPDTAGCDTNYYGFQNQVYGAARQFKIYAEGRYFTWYAPGRTWNILYNPNSGCGSSPVYIQNKATAGLYYYTPYQPNAAALRAGYGEGDGCSAYGNRNFYNYFTDWFGSTQTPSGPAAAALIQSGEPVYFVAGGTRFHVSATDYAEFTRTFGATRRVSDSVVSAYRDGGAASLFIRDSSTGDISLLQTGSRHHFATCDQLALWGSQCGSEMSIPSTDFTAIPSGAAMTGFARVAGGNNVYLLGPGTLSLVYDDRTATILNGGTMPYAATMSSSVAERLSRGLTRFEPGRLLTLAGSPRVYLPTADGQLLYVASWARATELGVAPSVAWMDVPEAAVAGYSRGELTEFVTCAGRVYYPASRVLYPVTTRAAEGFRATALDAATCGTLSLSTAAPLDAVYVKTAAKPEVYLARQGVYRHVTSPAVLTGMNGGAWPTVLMIGPDAAAALVQGKAIERVEYAAGTFVKSATDPRVYLATPDGRLLYLRAWSIADELGLPTTSLTIAPGNVLDSYRYDGDLSLWVSCADKTYFAASGRLQPVTANASAGFVVSTLDDETCRALTPSTANSVERVFVKADGAPEVYLAQGGAFHHVTSMATLIRLGGGNTPSILSVQSATIAMVPSGDPIG